MGYILVLDDDLELPELLDILLTDEGYEVQCARTIGQAREMVDVRPPDLVLFDLVLGFQTGEDFVRSYRDRPGSNAVLIALSGVAHLETEAARIGADGFLKKPFEVDELLALVARYVRRP